MTVRKKALLCGGLALMLVVAGCDITVTGPSEDEIRAQLRNEYNAWESGQQEPGITLSVPGGPVATSRIVVQATSQSSAVVQIWLDSQEVVRGTGEAETVVAVTDGRHRISASAYWCFPVPEKYQSVVDSTTYCPSSGTGQDVVVDTAPPFLLATARVEGRVVVVAGNASDATTGVEAVFGEGQRLVMGSQGGEFFNLSIPYDKVPPQEVWISATDLVGNSTPLQSVAVQLPPNRWERRDTEGELVELHTEPDFSPPAGILLAQGMEWLHFQNDQLQALPPSRWEKIGADGGLLEVRTDPSFCPDGGLLGFGSGVEWRQYVDGQLRPPVLYTPNEWYVLLCLIGLSPFIAILGFFLFQAVATNLVVHRVARRLAKAFEGATVLLEAARLQLEQPAIPEPVQQVLSGFLAARPEIAADLEAYLVERQGALLTDGKEVGS